MLVPFNSSTTERAYNNHQTGQIGGMNIPIYAGSKIQKGHGLGAIFGNLLKSALPVIKQGAISLGKTALKTGLGVAHEALSGKNVKQALKDNSQRAGRDILQQAIKSTTQTTKRSNKRKKRKVSTPSSLLTSKAKRRKTQRSRDIFS